LSLLERAGTQLGERIRQRVEAAAGPVEKLEGLVAASLEFFEEQPHVFDLIQRADAQRGPSSPWQKLRDEALELVLAVVRDGNRRGDFRVSDPATTALVLLGGLRAVLRFGQRPHAPDVARRIVRTVLFGAANEK